MKGRFFSFVFWCIFFPVYLVWRKRLSSENPSTIFVSREGKWCIFFVQFFSLLFFWFEMAMGFKIG